MISSSIVAGLVSIVTPSLDGAEFFSDTIRSVLAQSYPSLEYIVVDGGSRDDTITIARAFGDRVRILEMPSSSQAEAINAGFREARGEFLAFLGADDVLETGAIGLLVAALDDHAEAPYAYGDGVFTDDRGEILSAYPTRAFSVDALARSCFICQPATLMRAKHFYAVGGLDEHLNAAFDYDLWFRLAKAFPNPIRINKVVARARMHRNSKTFVSREDNFREACSVVRKHYGYVPFSWTHAYAGILTTKQDLFFHPPQGSKRRTLLTMWLGLLKNYRRPIRFLREFVSESIRLHQQKTRSTRV